MKRLDTIIRTLVLATLITGCNTRIENLQPELISYGTNSSETVVIKKENYRKQGISVLMDQFYPAPKTGMNWTYDLSRENGNMNMAARIEITIDKVSLTEVTVSINGIGEWPKMRFDRSDFWYEFTLFLTRRFHNKNFSEHPGSPVDDKYAIFETCPSDPAVPCGNDEVEIPSGKYLVSKVMIQEYVDYTDPNAGFNELNWVTSHFWISKDLGLVEMKLESTKQPNLGVTTMTLVKTNI
jgi:hypothetical protein